MPTTTIVTVLLFFFASYASSTTWLDDVEADLSRTRGTRSPAPPAPLPPTATATYPSTQQLVHELESSTTLLEWPQYRRCMHRYRPDAYFSAPFEANDKGSRGWAHRFVTEQPWQDTLHRHAGVRHKDARRALGDGDAMQCWIAQSQFEGPCSANVRIGVSNVGRGFGSRIRMLSSALELALNTNRRFVVPVGDWLEIADRARCEGTNYDCLFAPLSSYTRPDEDSRVEPFSNANAHNTSSSPSVLWNYHYNQVAWSHSGPRGKTAFNRRKQSRIPARFLARGQLWVQSQLTRYLLQPNSRSRRVVQRFREALGLQHPVIGIHIRHADKWVEAPLHPMSTYMERAARLRAQFGVRRIYLATDDGAVVEAARAAYPSWDFSFANHTRLNRCIEGKSRTYAVEAGAIGSDQVGMQVLADLFTLADCDYFIGTFSSNFGQLALKLMIARRGFVPPYFSLDQWPQHDGWTMDEDDFQWWRGV